jgi:hypothetical protein
MFLAHSYRAEIFSVLNKCINIIKYTSIYIFIFGLSQYCKTIPKNSGRSDEILGWEGVRNHQLFCFFKV